MSLVGKGIAHWQATKDLPLCEMSVGDFFDQQVEQYRTNLAILCKSYEAFNLSGVQWTYEDLQKKVNECAKALMNANFKKGNHIAVWTINIPEWVVLELACAKLGIVLVTMNPALRSKEAKYVLKTSEANAIFVLSHFANRDFVAEVIEMQDSLPYLETIVTFNEYSHASVSTYNELLRGAENILDEQLKEQQNAVQSEDLFQIQFTSGTTGFPKAAMLTHFNAVNNARFIFDRWEITEEDIIFSPLPLFHTAGCILLSLAAISVGAHYIMQPVFIPDDALNIIKENNVTHFGGVPTMWQGLLNELERNNEQLQLKMLMSGGAPVPEILLKRLQKRTQAKGVVLMGMTETGGIFSTTSPRDSLEKRAITSGQPLPHTEVKIVDPETNVVLPVNTPGEIVVKGYMVMKGYYKMPEETEEVLSEEGWLRTGDLGELDDEGYINVVGRLKDMIIRGGENIYPREVEDFLLGHPKISEVQVVGIPDEYYGEVPVAFIKLKEGEQATSEEIIDYCKGKISHQKTPVQIEFVDSYPLTSSGKVQKNILQEQFINQMKA